ILVGAGTIAFAPDAATVDKLGPLALKGKSAPVTAFRLLSVGEARARQHGATFVGRARELTLLRDAWARVLESEVCELVTIIGEPGVGKSRLVAEFVAALDARVASGRCLSYGEGITYFPVVQVIRQLNTAAADQLVAASLGSLLGESDVATSPEE